MTILLAALPDVREVSRHGDGVVVVTGGDDALTVVTSLLARERVAVRDLRVEQPGLDDAFVALTGRRLGE